MLAMMKTVTKSISLHQELADFADREAEAGCFGNMSAYFAELLRKARQAKIDQDLKLLAEGVEGAGPEPSDDEAVAPLKAIRRRMQKESWKSP
jgi:Arc/MetJ-type ribon-helix-helix transcriptional regulator